MDSTIGIVGCNGDLGSRLHNQILKSGIAVLGFDVTFGSKTDLTMDSSVFKATKKYTNSLDELVKKTKVIHWCAPLDEIEDFVDSFHDLERIILHDSVMSRSLHVKKNIFTDRTFKVEMLHALMNEHKRVMIAAESDDAEWLNSHVQSIGLRPKLTKTIEHDKLMAESQSLIALLCRDILPELKTSMKKGDLTPSGEALMIALTDREAHWTSATKKSILDNPELKNVVNKLSDTLNDKI